MTNQTAGENAARRREVVVNGERVRVVDMHAHVSIPEAGAIATQAGPGGGAAPSTAGRGLPSLLLANVAERLAAMDAQGIDVEALSINPYWYKFDRDTAAEVIRIQNEKLAEFSNSRSDRFVALASVALQHPDLAAQQLDDGVKRLGLRGALVGGSVAGEELANPKYHPFWAKAEELGCVIFIHPQGTAELESRLTGNGVLANVIGNPLETTIALAHLIFEGTLDRFPGLKILAAHGGGYMPSYAARFDHGGMTFPAQFTPLKKKPTEYLKQLYYDSIIFTSEGLRHLVAETSVDNIVLGTDYPFPWTTTAVEHIMDTPGFTDAERIAMLGGTAARLLKLDA